MDCKVIYQMADKAGQEAVERLQVRPMVVTQHSNPMDDNSPIERSWFVEDGICGFSWINIKPAHSKFAKFLLVSGLARKDSYNGGVTLWVSQYNQSLQKKETYAYAFSETLRRYDIKAYAGSRMD